MSYYRRGYSWEQVEYISAPVGGWNPDAVAWELPGSQAAALDNFLIRPGKIIARGAFSHLADTSATAPAPVGTVPAGALCISNMSTVGCMPWDAPVLGSAAASLAQASTTLTWADSLGNKQTSVVASRHLVPGPRWINFDGELYGLGFDSEAATLRDAASSYFAPATQLLTLPFSVVAPAGSASPSLSPSFTGASWALHGRPAYYYYNAPLVNGSSTTALVSTAFGLSVPTGATINTVSLVTEAITRTGSATLAVQLVHAGAPIGSVAFRSITPATGNITFSWSDFGSPALTPAMVSDSTFGYQVSFTNTSGGTEPLDTYASYAPVNSSFTITYSSSYTTPTTTALTNAPQGAIDLTGHLGAIWLLGGADTPGGSAVHSPTTIYYSNPITAGGGSATSDWKDPASGLTNKIRLDQDSSDPGMALASTRNGLIILRRNSTWALKGSTPSNFTVVQLAHDTGCLDPRSVVEADSGVFFVGQSGLYVTDGSRVTNVSGSVMYTLQQAIAAQQWSVITGRGGYITAGLTTGGQIILSLGARNNAGGLVPIWSGMYDPSLKVWTRLTSQCWSDDGTQTSPNYYPSLIVSDRLSALRSIHSVGSKYITLLEDQALAYSFLNQSSLYDSRLDGTTPAIPLVWKSRIMPIIGTTTLSRKWGQAKRFFIDYSFNVSGGTVIPGTSVGWTATPVDATDTAWDANAVLNTDVESSTTTSSISAGYGLGTTRAIQRMNQDFVSEVDDLGFDVTYADTGLHSSASGVVAAIYGIGVEYQPTRDKR